MEKLIFIPSEDDLSEAYRLYYNGSNRKRYGYLLGFAFLVGLILAALEGFSSIGMTLGLIIGMLIWATAAFGVIWLIIHRWWMPRNARKIYAQQKDLHLETEIWWDDDKLYSTNSQTQAHMAFSDMVKWRSNDKIVLLYRSDHLFNFLPARVFNDVEQIGTLIGLLEKAGVAGKKI